MVARRFRVVTITAASMGLIVCLGGCVAAGIAGTAVGVAGAAVGATAKVAGTAVSVTADTVGAAGRAVTGAKKSGQ